MSVLLTEKKKQKTKKKFHVVKWNEGPFLRHWAATSAVSSNHFHHQSILLASDCTFCIITKWFQCFCSSWLFSHRLIFVTDFVTFFYEFAHVRWVETSTLWGVAVILSPVCCFSFVQHISLQILVRFIAERKRLQGAFFFSLACSFVSSLLWRGALLIRSQKNMLCKEHICGY